MRVLFVGRLAVLGGLAAACEDVGHDVAFAGAPSTSEAVEGAGFEALSAGLDVEAEPDHVAAALAGDLAPLAGHWGADLLVHDDGAAAAGARLGADRARLPAFCVGTRPAVGDVSTLPPSFHPTEEPGRRFLRPGPFPAVERDIAFGPADWAFVMGALSHGTPLVLTPRDDEERYLAFRVTAAGAGVLAGPGAEQLLLDEPLYFANARRLRSEIEAMPSAADTVPLLT